MRFNPKARLDPGQLGQGGSGGGGFGGGRGGGIPIPTGRIGGVGSIILIILFFVVTQCMGVGLPGGGAGGGGTLGLDPGQVQAGQGAGSDRYAHCRTGADAAEHHDCARVAVVNSIQSFWSTHLADAAGVDYQQARTITFSGSVSTGCGQASSAVGPFYCPAGSSRAVYLDPTFFDQVLEGQLRGPDGDFVEWYVLGHEYGHHVQNLTGQMGRVRTQQGPDSDAVKLELQADCYAGMWVRAAVTTKDESGEPLFTEGPSDAEVALAIKAAEAVGDDHIQKVSRGRVDPDQWTHGSSDQRAKSFWQGYETGDYGQCAWERLPRS